MQFVILIIASPGTSGGLARRRKLPFRGLSSRQILNNPVPAGSHSRSDDPTSACPPRPPVSCPRLRPARSPWRRRSPTVAQPALVEQAKQRLSAKLGTETRWMTLVNLQTVTWRDESLGCPKGGQQDYAQVLTPGYLIELGSGWVYLRFPHRWAIFWPVLCEQTPPVETYLPP